MRERKKTFEGRPITVRLWTLKDKDSMFRVKRDDQHIVEIASANCIIREFVFDKAADATAHYEHLLQCFS